MSLESKTSHDFDRRNLLGTGAKLIAGAVTVAIAKRASGGPADKGGDFDLEEVTMAELQQRMQSGRATARSLVEKYLARIDALDRKGPNLRAVLETNPEALAIADALDAERKAGKVRGPLHGIPILLKDNIDTGDRMQTTAGSLALDGAPASADAFIAKRLRDAGAVLLGKANLSEWANIRSDRSSSGWSARGGQCRNPYALDRSPSGSSSGSGTAAAANLCAGTIGTETDGSIVSPSSICSLVGIKPTVGLCSRTGIIPISHTQDTPGPMTRTVADAALLLTAIAGVDPKDAATKSAKPADYSTFLDPNGLKGARIGVARAALFGRNLPAMKAAEAALETMKKLGAELIDTKIEMSPKIDKYEMDVLLYELKADLDLYLAARGAKLKSLAEVVKFNEENKDREMPLFGQEFFEQAVAKGPLTDKAYKTAIAETVPAAKKLLLGALDKNKLDALVAPTGGTPWLIDHVNGDSYTGSCSTLPAVSGFPHLTVPAGYHSGLPLGVSFIGRPYSEGTLIKLAYAFEQATKHRRPPRFLPTAEIRG